MNDKQKAQFDAYREAILKAMLERMGEAESSDAKRSACALLEQFSDEELADGMPFNTPDDVADILLEH